MSPVVQAELRFEDLVEVAGQGTSRAGPRWAGPLLSAVALVKLAEPTVDGECRRAVPVHRGAQLGVGFETNERSNSMCGDTGSAAGARWVGAMIARRAEKACAVDPVGVATIDPSLAYGVKKLPLMATSRRAVWPLRVFSSTASFSDRLARRDATRRRLDRHREQHRSSIACRPAKKTAGGLVQAARLDLGEVAEADRG
jgi:hypothetical protein